MKEHIKYQGLPAQTKCPVFSFCRETEFESLKQKLRKTKHFFLYVNTSK